MECVISRGIGTFFHWEAFLPQTGEGNGIEGTFQG